MMSLHFNLSPATISSFFANTSSTSHVASTYLMVTPITICPVLNTMKDVPATKELGVARCEPEVECRCVIRRVFTRELDA